jgi:hypothetical protein
VGLCVSFCRSSASTVDYSSSSSLMQGPLHLMLSLTLMQKYSIINNKTKRKMQNNIVQPVAKANCRR